MKQSKRMSLIESFANIGIGYIISTGAQFLIFPMFGIHVPFVDNLLIGLCFMVVSLARSYFIRRWFIKFE